MRSRRHHNKGTVIRDQDGKVVGFKDSHGKTAIIKDGKKVEEPKTIHRSALPPKDKEEATDTPPVQNTVSVPEKSDEQLALEQQIKQLEHERGRNAYHALEAHALIAGGGVTLFMAIAHILYNRNTLTPYEARGSAILAIALARLARYIAEPKVEQAEAAMNSIQEKIVGLQEQLKAFGAGVATVAGKIWECFKPRRAAKKDETVELTPEEIRVQNENAAKERAEREADLEQKRQWRQQRAQESGDINNNNNSEEFKKAPVQKQTAEEEDYITLHGDKKIFLSQMHKFGEGYLYLDEDAKTIRNLPDDKKAELRDATQRAAEKGHLVPKEGAAGVKPLKGQKDGVELKDPAHQDRTLGGVETATNSKKVWVLSHYEPKKLENTKYTAALDKAKAERHAPVSPGREK